MGEGWQERNLAHSSLAPESQLGAAAPCGAIPGPHFVDSLGLTSPLNFSKSFNKYFSQWLRTRHHSKLFAYNKLCNLYNNSDRYHFNFGFRDEGTEALRKSLAQGQRAGKQQGPNSDPGSLTPQSVGLATVLESALPRDASDNSLGFSFKF